MIPDRIHILIARKLAAEASPEELEELDHLLEQHPEFHYATHVLENPQPWRSGPSSTIQEEQASFMRARNSLFEKLVTEDPFPPRKTPVRRYMLAVAASALLLMGLYLAWMHQHMPASQTLSQNEIITKGSSKSMIVLPDGSKVWLNSFSRLSYADGFLNGKREVTLYGEGFFEVKHDPKHPFVIHARNVDIRVLGTVFNVKAYPEDRTIETTLLKGKVEVDFNNSNNQKVYLKPHQKITIYENGSQATLQPLTAGGTSQVQAQDFAVSTLKPDTAHLIPEIAWMSDKLEFNQESFEELAHDLERWYNVRIDFKNNTYKQDIFTGAFKNQSIREIMEALQMTSHFHYRIDSASHIVIW